MSRMTDQEWEKLIEHYEGSVHAFFPSHIFTPSNALPRYDPKFTYAERRGLSTNTYNPDMRWERVLSRVKDLQHLIESEDQYHEKPWYPKLLAWCANFVTKDEAWWELFAIQDSATSLITTRHNGRAVEAFSLQDVVTGAVDNLNRLVMASRLVSILYVSPDCQSLLLNFGASLTTAAPAGADHVDHQPSIRE